MEKIERLNKYLDEAKELMRKDITRDDPEFESWNNALIRFIEMEYGKESSLYKMFKDRPYTYLVYAIGSVTHNEFSQKCKEDLKVTINDLTRLIDEENDGQYNKSNNIKDNKTKNQNGINININNSNSTQNNLSNIINMNISDVKEKIEDNSYLDDESKKELLSKLEEINRLQKSNESKTKKWQKAREILKFILDKGADIAIMFLPQILKAIS